MPAMSAAWSGLAGRGHRDPRPRLTCAPVPGEPRYGKEAGVLVRAGGLGTLEDNEITGSGLTGVEIQAGADPVLRRNQIHRNGYAGVWVDEAGKGVIEDNDLTENAEGARTIARGYARNVTRARNKE